MDIDVSKDKAKSNMNGNDKKILRRQYLLKTRKMVKQKTSTFIVELRYIGNGPCQIILHKRRKKKIMYLAYQHI